MTPTDLEILVTRLHDDTMRAVLRTQALLVETRNRVDRLESKIDRILAAVERLVAE